MEFIKNISLKTVSTTKSSVTYEAIAEIDQAAVKSVVDAMVKDMHPLSLATTATTHSRPQGLTFEMMKGLVDKFTPYKLKAEGKEIDIYGYDVHKSEEHQVDILTKRDGEPDTLPDMIIVNHKTGKTFLWNSPFKQPPTARIGRDGRFRLDYFD